jgi:basic membrane protein A
MKKRTFMSLAGTAVIAATSLLGTTQIAYANDPTDLNIAVVLSAGLESSWDGSLIEALERAQAAKPHGLNITWEYTDPLWGEDAGDAIRLFADSGAYDIIWAHSSYSDQVKNIKDDFPDLPIVVSGSGNEGLGGNQYWIYKRVHESAYVLGILAGSMTKTNTIGAVGTFAADDINDALNAYFAGARSVNPEIKQKVAFIESWYDPGKASEMTAAQISTGVDVIFTLAGNFKPCEEAKIVCFGNFADQSSYSPETVLSSTIANWDPEVSWIIGEWWNHETTGAAYNGNTDIVWHGMADGGTSIAPYHGLEDSVPADVRALVDETIAKITSGELVVDLDVSLPHSD